MCTDSWRSGRRRKSSGGDYLGLLPATRGTMAGRLAAATRAHGAATAGVRTSGRVDLLGFRGVLADLDPPGLGPLGDRDPQGQHAGVISGLDVVGVQALAEEQLAAEHAERPFRDL